VAKMPQLVKERKKSKKLGEPKVITREEYQEQDIEPRLNKLIGYRHLPSLRKAIMKN